MIVIALAIESLLLYCAHAHLSVSRSSGNVHTGSACDGGSLGIDGAGCIPILGVTLPNSVLSCSTISSNKTALDLTLIAMFP